MSRMLAPALACLLCLPLLLTAQSSLPAPLAHWDFDDGAGATLADRGPHAFDGQVFGAAWTQGMQGGALQFSAPGHYVDVTDGNGQPDLIGNLMEGTISVWFRFDSVTPAGQIHPVLYLGDGTGGPNNASLIVEVGHFAVDTELYFTILDGTGFPVQCFDSGFPLQVGTWYHFAAVVGPDFNMGYLDGQPMTARHYNFGTATDHDFFGDVPGQQVCWFGRGKLGFDPADQWFHGALDEFRIYSQALTPQQVHELWMLGLQTWPGTLEDFSLATGVGGAAPTTGGGEDSKQVLRGQFLDVSLASPGWTFLGAPVILAGELLGGGSITQNPSVPGLWLSLPGLFILVDGTWPGPLGFSHVITPGGATFGFQVPLGLAPQDLVLQAAAISPLATLGFALSEAHVITIL